MSSTRMVALDVGTVRIGIAAADLLLAVPVGLETYVRRSGPEDVEYLAARIREEEAGILVVGLPLRADGSKGRAAAKIERFIGYLHAALPEVELLWWNEQRTSQEADRLLHEAGTRGERAKQLQDQFAATVLLVDLLSSPMGEELRRRSSE